MEAQVQEFHRRPLADDCPYLIVDAVDLQTRGTPQQMATARRQGGHAGGV